MSDETNGDGTKYERPEVVDDMAMGVSFFSPEEEQTVAPTRPIVSASGDEMTFHVRWFLQRAVDELEHQEADVGTMRACEHVPSVIESAVPWIWACVDHPDEAGLMCFDCLEAHHVAEHGFPRKCSMCSRADSLVEPAVTVPQLVQHHVARVRGSRERFGIRGALMVLAFFFCDGCRVRGFEQAREIEALEWALYHPDSER